MSLRRFDGWEPREYTEVTAWDEQGRPLRWITRREPEWDPRERGWMLALDWHESSLCRKCGQPLAECTDPANDPDNPASERMYVAEPPTECFSCKVLVKADEKWHKDSPETSGFVIHTAALVDRPQRRPARRG
ncbi:hypothetical protein GCM10011608_09960 [Micromonospora sonchi]|uniref:Uncharacterized protein n=1 Tax=Micromonospora sonchi TaxID=1763543 RepID=A0A917TLW1_9ACTN|nr:hypothetical protein [Micromonospora sonchi]GGM27187.1 hypothetical protein GCM10011608_09960 [Micromonospora sonchi]